MPDCSVLQCKNNSRTINNKNGGVSYHLFPKDPVYKGKWIDATGRVNWWPTKSSTICSKHFLEEHIIISKKGYKYLKPTALPTLHIVKFYDEQKSTNDGSAGSLKKDNALVSYDKISPSEGSQQDEHFKVTCKNEMICEVNPDYVLDSRSRIKFETETFLPKDPLSIDCTCSTSKKEKLELRLKFCENKILKQNKKIKYLQQIKRRLKKKMNSMDEMLKNSEKKFVLQVMS